MSESTLTQPHSGHPLPSPPVHEKRPPKPRTSGWYFKMLFFMAIVGSLVATVIGGLVFLYFARGLPAIITVEDYRPFTVTQIYGSDPSPVAPEETSDTLGEFYKERRYLVPYEKIPEVVVQAFISAEDDSFFHHQGINLVAIARAGIANFRAGHVVQGGSTITQQVAKSLLLTPERSINRKIKEVILASRIERNLSKQQILFLYLNQIYLGNGAYGVQAAAKAYFRKDVSNLTLAEAAMLAGMPQAPGKYSPHLNPKKAKERQLYVLRRMFENKYATQDQMTEAAAQPVRLYVEENPKKRDGAYFVEHVRRYLLEKYGEKTVYEGGLSVQVTASQHLARTAARSMKEGLRDLDKRIGYRGPIKKLKTPEEIEKKLAEIRLDLIQKRLGYTVWLPDGTLDPFASIKEAGIEKESDLFLPKELYQAVVTRVDNEAKVAHVMVGTVKAEIPLSAMRWARPLNPDGSAAWNYDITSPSTAVSKNDLVWVSWLRTEADGKVIVALEQQPEVQGALLSMETLTGKVLAMEGGYDFSQSEFNRATQAMRQPGSAFKPIIYAAGLEKGFTPASVIQDSPIVLNTGEEWGAYKPDNYDEKFYGDTTYRQALIKSRNIPTIKIVQAMSLPFLLEYAQRLGLNGQFNRDISTALGSGSVTLLDLTRTYTLFPRLGRRVEPIFVLKVTDRDGRVLEETTPVTLQPWDQPLGPVLGKDGKEKKAPAGTAGTGEAVAANTVVIPPYPTSEDPDQVMDPRIAYVMTHLMKEVVRFGTGQDAKALQRPTAGKTGTTNDAMDAWFMGFTPFVATGVWVGYDAARSMGSAETGSKAALPIWLNFMMDAVKPYSEQDFRMPPGVVYATIDPATGKLASAQSNAIREAFVEGTEPTEVSTAGPGGEASQGEFLKEDF